MVNLSELIRIATGLLGLALLVVCAALVYPPAGFGVAGAGLLALAIDARPRKVGP